jgi:hypothetical protein
MAYTCLHLSALTTTDDEALYSYMPINVSVAYMGTKLRYLCM